MVWRHFTKLPILLEKTSQVSLAFLARHLHCFLAFMVVWSRYNYPCCVSAWTERQRSVLKLDVYVARLSLGNGLVLFHLPSTLLQFRVCGLSLTRGMSRCSLSVDSEDTTQECPVQVPSLNICYRLPTHNLPRQLHSLRTTSRSVFGDACTRAVMLAHIC